MSDTPRYGKVYTIDTYYDGKLSNRKTEIEIQHTSSNASFIRDLIDTTADSISGECKEITLKINANKSGVKMITINKSMRHERGQRFIKQ